MVQLEELTSKRNHIPQFAVTLSTENYHIIMKVKTMVKVKLCSICFPLQYEHSGSRVVVKT